MCMQKGELLRIGTIFFRIIVRCFANKQTQITTNKNKSV